MEDTKLYEHTYCLEFTVVVAFEDHTKIDPDHVFEVLHDNVNEYECREEVQAWIEHKSTKEYTW